MEIELERTFLAKSLPGGLKNSRSVEIVDVYLPTHSNHPVLRLRKSGDRYEITKKEPKTGTDSSEQTEYTIALSKDEFEELATLPGKRFRKIRHYFPIGDRTAEIDVYQDALEGLVVVDVEFKTAQEKDAFHMPDFCLIDVTQERTIAGGMLAGKTYEAVEPFLSRVGYRKILT